MKKFMFQGAMLKNLRNFLGFRGVYMKEEKKELLLILLISGIIGLFVGFVEISMDYMNHENVNVLIRDIIMGIIIGFFSRFWFIYLHGKKRMNIKLVFLIVFITIGGISMIPAMYLSIVRQRPLFTMKLLGIFLTAEILGLGLSSFFYKYSLNLNHQLNMKKEEFLKVKERQ